MKDTGEGRCKCLGNQGTLSRPTDPGDANEGAQREGGIKIAQIMQPRAFEGQPTLGFAALVPVGGSHL